jgi:hypothetical protein
VNFGRENIPVILAKVSVLGKQRNNGKHKLPYKLQNAYDHLAIEPETRKRV